MTAYRPETGIEGAPGRKPRAERVAQPMRRGCSRVTHRGDTSTRPLRLAELRAMSRRSASVAASTGTAPPARWHTGWTLLSHPSCDTCSVIQNWRLMQGLTRLNRVENNKSVNTAVPTAASNADPRGPAKQDSHRISTVAVQQCRPDPESRSDDCAPTALGGGRQDCQIGAHDEQALAGDHSCGRQQVARLLSHTQRGVLCQLLPRYLMQPKPAFSHF